MTPLRQRMTEDMQVRNFALNTQTSYRQVSLFAPLQPIARDLGPGGDPGLSALISFT
jgi:integrase/recombinase XerD